MKCLVAVVASFLRRFDGAIERKEAVGFGRPVGDGAVTRYCFGPGSRHCTGFANSDGLASSFVSGAWSG